MSQYQPVLVIQNKNGTQSHDILLSKPSDNAITFDELIELSTDWIETNIDDIETINLFLKSIDFKNAALSLDPEAKRIVFQDDKAGDTYNFFIQELFEIRRNDYKEYKQYKEYKPGSGINYVNDDSEIDIFTPVSSYPIFEEDNPLEVSECSKLSSSLSNDEIEYKATKATKYGLTVPEHIVEEAKQLNKAIVSKADLSKTTLSYGNIVKEFFKSNPTFEQLIDFAGLAATLTEEQLSNVVDSSLSS